MTTAPDPIAPVSVAGGRYRILRLLGEGRQKRVYLAHDTRLDRDVALALIRTDGLNAVRRARLRTEMQATGRLGDHPHIVTLFDAGEDGGQPYLVSEYVAGGSLEERLANSPGGRMTMADVLRIADHLCRALAFAHARGVIHRDLKPSNVWLTEDGVAKLGDFGVALALDSPRVTSEGVVVGTAAYLAPEQALGKPADARSDLYALGAVLYELVTGRPPFLGDDFVGVVFQHLNTAPVAPSWHRPDVSSDLEAVVLRLLAKSPEARPAGAEAVLEALGCIQRGESEPTAPSSGTANPLDRLAGGVFVGREAELRQLQGAIEGARKGHGRLALLHGEPGIGKTRTLEEVATYAGLRGMGVVWGRCYESSGAPAFWPWVQVVRSLAADRDAEELRRLLGDGAPAIAQVVPELRTRLPDVADPPALPPDQARFRLFDSVSQFLRNVGAAESLLVVLDDVQGADTPSLLMLQFAARELADSRVLLLAACRDLALDLDQPLTQVVGDVLRAPSTACIALSGLSEAEVARFIVMTAGVDPPPALVSALHGETAGNPFFVIEVVRLLIAEGRFDATPETPDLRVGIPVTVRAAIARRLGGLSAAARKVLRIAAVAGLTISAMACDFGSEVLARVSGTADAGLTEAVDEAVGARFLMERGHQRYRFRHALVRETLYEGMPASLRARLHWEVGKALEEVSAGAPDPPLAELAHHFAAAGDHVTPLVALEYARRAGERASGLLAYEEAARYYRMALDLLDRAPTAEPGLHCELLLALGEAQRKAGDTATARKTLLAAADAARAAEAPEKVASAALALGWSYEAGHDDGAFLALLEEAAAALPSEDNVLRARVLARLAREITYSDTADRRVELGETAIAMARRLKHPGALAEALTARHYAVWELEDLDARLAAADEIVRLGDAASDAETALWGRMWRLVTLLERGDIRSSDDEIESTARLGEKFKLPAYVWYARVWRAMRSLMQGRFAEAEALATEALALGQRIDEGNAAQTFSAQLYVLRREQGRSGEMEPGLAAMTEQHPNLPWRSVLAAVYADMGRVEDAHREFERVAAADFTDLARDGHWLAALATVINVCCFLGDAPRAALLYEMLRPFAGRVIVASYDATVCDETVSRHLGRLAATMGRWDDAAAHFESAFELSVRIAARPWIAHLQHDWAAVLIARDGPGDRAAARERLEHAIREAEAMGMAAVAEHAAALKAQIENLAPDLAVAVARARRYSILKTTEERLRVDILAQRHAAPRRDAYPEIVGASPAIQEVLALMESAAASPILVLLEGETGTGKELVARGIHRTSPRAAGPFLPVNCAALPENLLESELFGHRRGAFTGATQDRTGLFEAAAGGTVFLDEIGELPAAMQAKLLRVLQDGEIKRLGENAPRRIDVRVIAASNRDLAAEVAAGRFREDVYYRLAALPIQLPSLRSRRKDIPLLTERFLTMAAERHGKRPAGLGPDALDLLGRYDWPGNVRELENAIARAVALVRDGERIEAAHFAGLRGIDRTVGAPIAKPTPAPPSEVGSPSLRSARDAFEARYIAEVLQQHGGNVSRAAASMGLSRVMLHRKMRKYGLR